jgi:hypothetical protein
LALSVAALGAAGCGSARTVVERTVTVPKVTTTVRSLNASPTLSQLVSRVQSGVVRIESDNCYGTDIGTGFELSSRVVATVEHVVDGASAIRILRNDQVVAHASIIGADPDQDLALLLTDEPLQGQPLALDSREPQLGQSVAAIGFPLGLPLSVTQGTVSGLDRTIPIDGYLRHNLIQTDAAVNPGNSGGPLLAIDSGKVIGLVDLGTTQANGLGFAVSSTVALKEFAGWRSRPQPVRAVRCPATPAALPSSAASPPYYLPPSTGPGMESPGTTGNSSAGSTGSGGYGSGSGGGENTGAGAGGNTAPGNTGAGNTGAGNTGSGNTGSATGNTGGAGSANTGTGSAGSGNTGGATGNTGSATGNTGGAIGNTGGAANDQNSSAGGAGSTGNP